MFYTLRFYLQNAVCFVMLSCLVPVLFTFYIQGVLKLKKNISGAKGLINSIHDARTHVYKKVPRSVTKCHVTSRCMRSVKWCQILWNSIIVARKQGWAERWAVMGKAGSCYVPVNLLWNTAMATSHLVSAKCQNLVMMEFTVSRHSAAGWRHQQDKSYRYHQ